MSDVLNTHLQQALVDIFSDSPLVTLEQNVDRALETITQQLCCDGVFVLCGSLLPSQVRTRNLYLKPQFSQGQRLREWPLAKLPYFRQLVRTPQLVNLANIDAMPADALREKELLRQMGVKSLLVLPPVIFGETRIAVGAVNCSFNELWSQTFVNELSHASAMIGSAMELTRIAEALMASQRRYQELFNQLPLACGLLDKNNKLTLLNHVATQSLSLKNNTDLLSYVREDKRNVLLETLDVVRDGFLGQSWCELPIKNQLLGFTWFKLNFSLCQSDKHTVVMMAEDVNERYRLADELSFHANYDALTGLPNRLQFEALLDNLQNNEVNIPVCVGCVDLDQFQVVNNVSGHQAGDKLLCQVALRLKQLVRKGDIVARLGGDEFGIIMHYSNNESAKMIAERICSQLFKHEFSWGNRQHSVSVSMGVAELNREINDIYTVMSQADVACRLAKDEGRNGWHIYCDNNPKMRRLYTEMTASVDILGALALNQFELYYQLIEPLSSKESGLHMEILLRMHKEDGSILSPAIFLPAAERYNLASRVDRWVIDNLLRWGSEHLHLWQELAMVSVNLSATSLGDTEFMDWLDMRLMTEPELVDKLCFEITETAAVSQLEQATDLIELLKPLGCKLALDDFGSGFSSFAYLKRLDVDFVKIDGQFVLNLCDNRADQAIVSSICQLGRDMEFEVIAEFVETTAIGYRLRDLGVDYAQGYAIAKPIPLATLQSGRRTPWLETLAS